MHDYHSVPVIVDANAWGIGGWDENLALEAMVQAADSMHLGLDAFDALGFIPSDHEHGVEDLEYAFDDACISRHARTLGMTTLPIGLPNVLKDGKLGESRDRIRQPKRQGAWVQGFDPREVNFNFTEANGWQYLFAPVHDVSGQRDILGGDEGYLARLEALFTAPVETTGRVQPDITGPWVNMHGNEPSHHVAYLASYAGDAGAGRTCVPVVRRHVQQRTRRTVRQRRLRPNECLVCGQRLACTPWFLGQVNSCWVLHVQARSRVSMAV